MVAAALFLLVTSAAALRFGNRAWLALPACAVALLAIRGVVDVDERLGWVDRGVISHDEPRAGPLLGPALDDLQASARRSPEASDPGWELLDTHGYRSRGLTGWRLIEELAVLLGVVTTYRAFRLGMRRRFAIGATAVAAIVALGWWVARGLDGLA